MAEIRHLNERNDLNKWIYYIRGENNPSIFIGFKGPLDFLKIWKMVIQN